MRKLAREQGMELLLWRHADAEDGEPDELRQLSAKGLRQAEKMGRWLRRQAPDELRVLVSPTMRTRQTALAFRDDVRLCEAIGPAAGGAELLAAAGWPEAGGAVLLVGHQPALGEAASLILGASAPQSFRKACLWWFSRRRRADGDETLLRAVIGASELD